MTTKKRKISAKIKARISRRLPAVEPQMVHWRSDVPSTSLGRMPFDLLALLNFSTGSRGGNDMG